MAPLLRRRVTHPSALLQALLVAVLAVTVLAPDMQSIATQLQDGSQLQDVNIDTSTFRWYLFLFLMAFLVAATVEESVKLLLVRCVCCTQQPCCVQRFDQVSPTRKLAPRGCCLISRVLAVHSITATYHFCCLPRYLLGSPRLRT